jgi:hypothetical protein
MDIYSKYHLTKEEAVAKGIYPLEYVAIESPRFAEEVSAIPPELAHLINKQELVWTLSIEATYEQRRRWNEFLAIREIIQNALDAEQESVGYDSIAVKIEKDRLGTWVKDRGPGIRHKAFVLGGEQKPCEMRGTYGEGLKISLIWFTTKGYPLFFFTRGTLVYSCYYSKVADALVVVFGESVHDTHGTKALILGYGLPAETYKKMYYKAAKFRTICRYSYKGKDCNVETPNLVLSPGGSLYVRDIYVNEIERILTKPSFFSYNLWWVELEPNRETVNSGLQLGRELARLLESCTKITDMIEASLIEREFGGIRYFLLDDKYFETSIPYSRPTDGVLSAVQRLLANHGITAYSDYGDFDGMGAVNHEGGVCLLAPRTTHELLRNLPKAAEYVTKQKERLLMGKPILDERRFDGYNRGRLQMYRLLANITRSDTKIVLYEAERCHYDPGLNTIFIVPDVLQYIEDHNFIHELAHALGHARYPTAPDLTENFEIALAEVAATVLRFMTFHNFREAAIRCSMNCCIHAEPKELSEFFPRELYENMPGMLKTVLFRDPVMFIFATPDNRYAAAGSLVVLHIPFEEHFDKTRDQRIKHFEAIRRAYKEGTTTLYEVKTVIEKECHLFSQPAGENLLEIFDISPLTVYAYNYIKDRYEEVKKLYD